MGEPRATGGGRGENDASTISTQSAARWRLLFAEHASTQPVTTAETFHREWASASAAVLLECDDGRLYVVKSHRTGRMVVNDRIVGLLGQQLGAPVGEVALVNVPRDLLDIEPRVQHVGQGVSHGSVWIPDCSDDRQELRQPGAGPNRERFALLAVLYGWVGAQDHQVLYGIDPPNLVYSVDHGHFFPGGPNWSTGNLMAAGLAAADPKVMNDCGLRPTELAPALDRLAAIGDHVIASAIAAVPDAWGLPIADRVVCAHYLARRRDELLATRPAGR